MTQRKIILITGAAKSLGKAMSLWLMEHGYHIALHFNHSAADAERLAKEHEHLTVFQTDLMHKNGPETLIQSVYHALGPIYGLINNASFICKDSATTIERETAYRLFDVNFFAPLLLSKAFAATPFPNPKIRRHIIHMLDYTINHPAPDFFSYSMSKLALAKATTELAQCFAPTIRVNAIAPGPSYCHPHQSKERFDHVYQDNPLNYGVTPEDICQTALFLLQQPSITGQIIYCDGGKHLARHQYY